MYQMVQMLSSCTVYLKYTQHLKFYCNFWIHNFNIKCCLTFLGSVYATPVHDELIW